MNLWRNCFNGNVLLFKRECLSTYERKRWVMKCTLLNIFGHFNANCFWERNMTEFFVTKTFEKKKLKKKFKNIIARWCFLSRKFETTVWLTDCTCKVVKSQICEKAKLWKKIVKLVWQSKLLKMRQDLQIDEIKLRKKINKKELSDTKEKFVRNWKRLTRIR